MLITKIKSCAIDIWREYGEAARKTVFFRKCSVNRQISDIFHTPVKYQEIYVEFFKMHFLLTNNSLYCVQLYKHAVVNYQECVLFQLKIWTISFIKSCPFWLWIERYMYLCDHDGYIQSSYCFMIQWYNETFQSWIVWTPGKCVKTKLTYICGKILKAQIIYSTSSLLLLRKFC